MSERRAESPQDRRTTEYLASERTFLAWVRTSIAVIAFGFVVARFGVWLRELAASTGARAPVTDGGVSLPTGLAMMAFGAILVVLALWRYYSLNRAIERGKVHADHWLVTTVTVLVVLLAVVMIAYLLAIG